jgi:hypothetical protein
LDEFRRRIAALRRRGHRCRWDRMSWSAVRMITPQDVASQGPARCSARTEPGEGGGVRRKAACLDESHHCNTGGATATFAVSLAQLEKMTISSATDRKHRAPTVLLQALWAFLRPEARQV